MSSVLELHARDCARHANNFAAFAHRNPSMPYAMKKQVFDAAILSAMPYGCESWSVKGTLRTLSRHYLYMVKGVRQTTNNLMCPVESVFSLETTIHFPEENSSKCHRRRTPLYRAIRVCQEQSKCTRIKPTRGCICLSCRPCYRRYSFAEISS